LTKRTEIQLLSDILEILKTPRKPTHTMYLDHGKLSYTQLKKILEKLLKNNFITKNHHEYLISDKGTVFLTMMREYLNG